MVSPAFVLLATAAAINPCSAFNLSKPSSSARPITHTGPLKSTTEDASATEIPTKPSLDPDIASQFTIQVCTSTNCSRKLKEQGLDQYNALGEIYACAQEAGLEKCVIIEDGGCQGGKNCKLGPCVGIQHDDFDGNVGLEGMNSNELRERVFHNIFDGDDAARVWSSMENAIQQMAEEEDEA